MTLMNHQSEHITYFIINFLSRTDFHSNVTRIEGTDSKNQGQLEPFHTIPKNHTFKERGRTIYLAQPDPYNNSQTTNTWERTSSIKPEWRYMSEKLAGSALPRVLVDISWFLQMILSFYFIAICQRQ